MLTLKKQLCSLFIKKGDIEARLCWHLTALVFPPPGVRGGELTQRLLNNYQRIQNIIQDNKHSVIKLEEETLKNIFKTRYEVFSCFLKENDRFPLYFNNDLKTKVLQIKDRHEIFEQICLYSVAKEANGSYQSIYALILQLYLGKELGTLFLQWETSVIAYIRNDTGIFLLSFIFNDK